MRLVCGGWVAAGLCGGRYLRALRGWGVERCTWGVERCGCWALRVCGSAGMRAV